VELELGNNFGYVPVPITCFWNK